MSVPKTFEFRLSWVKKGCLEGVAEGYPLPILCLRL